MKIFSLTPIAFVKNNRTHLKDDFWGDVISEIVLSDEIPDESLNGIENYSHVEIIFVFDKALDSKIVYSCHPRENKDWPLTGIFAQRRKLRPNFLGATFAEIVERKERSLFVKNLDAIDGTPVLDIKPIVKEFLPQGEIRQPQWVTELMKDYWKDGEYGDKG